MCSTQQMVRQAVCTCTAKHDSKAKMQLMCTGRPFLQCLQGRSSDLLYRLQGDHFPADLQCRFGNASLVYVVEATVTDAQSASCTSPEWFADNNTRVNFSATTSGCDILTAMEFAYYLDPQVSQVAPLSGPRYGSFELRVQLEESVCSFADEVKPRPFRRHLPCT